MLKYNKTFKAYLAIHSRFNDVIMEIDNIFSISILNLTE